MTTVLFEVKANFVNEPLVAKVFVEPHIRDLRCLRLLHVAADQALVGTNLKLYVVSNRLASTSPMWINGHEYPIIGFQTTYSSGGVSYTSDVSAHSPTIEWKEPSPLSVFDISIMNDDLNIITGTGAVSITLELRID